MKEISRLEVKLGPILLDVGSHESLEEAWGASSREEVDDYNSRELAQSFYHKGQSHPKCLKETWITELPKTLIFTLGRVAYDRAQFALVKNAKRFTFPERLYADSHLLDHARQEQTAAKRIALLQDRQRALQARLQAYSNHEGIGPLARVLKAAHDFVEGQTEEFEEIKTSSLPEDHKSPLSIGKLGQRHSEIASALSVLDSFRAEVERQTAGLERELASIAEELQRIHSETNKEAYHLHAILVHEGTTENGHYVAFVLDRKQAQWYRFNDYKVTPEATETVMAEAFGGLEGPRQACAYGLVYVNQEIASSQEQLSFAEYNQALS